MRDSLLRPAPNARFGANESERRQLSIKDRLEVLALRRKPFEEPCPRMQTPWPGQFQRFSLVSATLMPDERRELRTNARLATHCSRRVLLYHALQLCARGEPATLLDSHKGARRPLNPCIPTRWRPFPSAGMLPHSHSGKNPLSRLSGPGIPGSRISPLPYPHWSTCGCIRRATTSRPRT